MIITEIIIFTCIISHDMNDEKGDHKNNGINHNKCKMEKMSMPKKRRRMWNKETKKKLRLQTLPSLYRNISS